MTGAELVTHMRESVLDDVAEPYLWKTTELLRFLNYAEVQACRRAHLLIDSTTATDSGTAATASTNGTRALCRVTIVGDTATYILSTKILQIRRCQLQTMTYPLNGPASYTDLDELESGWFGTSGTIGTAGSGGNPWTFLNEPNNMLTFVQAPSVSDTAFLVVSRLPLLPFTLQTSPEVDEQYHIDLCDWAAHLAFSKPDPDTFNPKMAAYYDQKFTAKFGPLPDAYSERMRKTICMHGAMRAREFGS